MDYQYIKSIVNEIYTDLPSRFNFPAECMDEIRKYCLDDSFISAGVNDVYTYFMSSEQGKPVVVFSKTAKKNTAKSVGYYAQCLGWAWSKELTKQIPEDVFGSAYMKETEIDDLGRQNADISKITGRVEFKNIEVSSEAIRAVLYGVIRRWLIGSAPVRIAVPVNEEYDSYVVSAVRAIYDFFPMALRLRAGFRSYLPSEQTGLNKIFIGFIPELESDDGTIFLDGRSNAAYSKYISDGCGIKSIDRLVEHVAHIPGSERQTFLDEIYEDVEGAGDPQRISSIGVEAYDPAGKMLAYMEEGQSFANMFPRWMEFLAQQYKFPAHMRNVILNYIEGHLESEQIFNYAAEKFIYEEETKLVRETAKYFVPLCTTFPQFRHVIYDAVIGRLNNCGFDDSARKLELFEKFANSIIPQIVSYDDLAKLKVDSLQDDYNQVCGLPLTTPAQADNAIGALKAILSKISPYESYSNGKNFAQEIEKRIVELKKKRNSSDMLYYDSLRAIQMANDYFCKLEEYFKIENRITELEENQQKQLWKEARAARPESIPDYQKAFKGRFGCALTLQNLSKLNKNLCKTIIRDLSSFKEVPVKFQKGISADRLNESIVKAEAISDVISENCKVCFEGLPESLSKSDARWLLELNTDGMSAENRKALSKHLFWLARRGVYSGKDLPAICQFLCSGENEKIEEETALNLIDYIEKGCFGNCTADDYWLTFETIFLKLNSEKPIEKLEILRKKIADNTEAGTILSKYIELHSPEEKKAKNISGGEKRGRKAVLISLVAAVAVLCVSTATLGVLLDKSGTALKAEQLNIEELTQAAENNFDIALFDKEFDTYREIFESAVNNDMGLLENIYREYDFSEEISIGGCKTTWAELFFWNSVYAAKDGEITEESFANAKKQAECAVVLINGSRMHEPEKIQVEEENELEIGMLPEKEEITFGPKKQPSAANALKTFDNGMEAEDKNEKKDISGNTRSDYSSAAVPFSNMPEGNGLNGEEKAEVKAADKQNVSLKADVRKIVSVAEESFFCGKDIVDAVKVQ